MVVSDGYGSVNRFVKGAYYLKKLPEFKALKDAVSYGFETMTRLEEPAKTKYPTQWTIVRDVVNKKLYFRTIDNTNIRTIDMENIDFSQEQPVKVMDINAEFSGNIIEHLAPYAEFKKLSDLREKS